jgi:hypothetical protein
MSDSNEKSSSLAAIRLFRELQTMKAELQDNLNSNELVDAMIGECIESGFDVGKNIVGIISRIGYTPKHIGMRLALGTGVDPSRHSWCKDSEGRLVAIRRSSAETRIQTPQTNSQDAKAIVVPKHTVSAAGIRSAGQPQVDDDDLPWH